MILHIATRAAWQQAQAAGAYRGDTLDVQGFIHCSHLEQLAAVANSPKANFRGRTDLMLLAIDESLLQAELREEEGEPGRLFPHIYGPLNLDAVVRVIDFPPHEDGTFMLPPEAITFEA